MPGVPLPRRSQERITADQVYVSKATVQKTAAHHDTNLPVEMGVGGAPVGHGSRDRGASSGEQMLATPPFAGMPGSERNRCLFRGARRGSSGGDPKPILIAGRDNFRDNHADDRLRVTCDVVYT